MTGARERDRTVGRAAGDPGFREAEDTEAAARPSAGAESSAGTHAPDERGAAAEAGGRTARTGSTAALAPAPAKEEPPHDGPAATGPAATAGTVAADPVAVADPVAPAPGTPAAPASPESGSLPPTADDDGRGTDRPLMEPSERDELGDRLHRATGRFLDDPPGAVDDACLVLGDLGERIAALLAERRDAYRDLSRHARTTEGAANAETERLRLALRDSRDLAERLLKL